MRLTTKIITGIILSIFVLPLLLIIGYSFTDRRSYRSQSYTMHDIKLPPSEQIGINIDKCRVIKFEEESKYHYHRAINGENGLFVLPVQSAKESNKLFIPETLNDYTSIQVNNDTLVVRIKIDEIGEKYGKKDESLEKRQRQGVGYRITLSGFNLYLRTSKVNIVNQLNDIQTHISNMETDSIKIYSLGEITIDACKAHVIEPDSKRKITIRNSAAKTLNMDLDQVTDWRIENCDIKERNYSGSRRNHIMTFSEKETGTINWLPKNENAELTMKFKGDSAQIKYIIK